MKSFGGKSEDLINEERDKISPLVIESALGHAVVLRRPRALSLAKAKAESCKAILGYLAC